MIVESRGEKDPLRAIGLAYRADFLHRNDRYSDAIYAGLRVLLLYGANDLPKDRLKAQTYGVLATSAHRLGRLNAAEHWALASWATLVSLPARVADDEAVALARLARIAFDREVFIDAEVYHHQATRMVLRAKGESDATLMIATAFLADIEAGWARRTWPRSTSPRRWIVSARHRIRS